MFKSIIGSATALIVFAGFGNIPNFHNAKSLFISAAHANNMIDASIIDAVHFKRGRLVQTDKTQGVWTEYDSRGNERYQFRTLSYNENSLTLKGTKGNVRLVVNFIDNIISGEWPGHSMAPLYEVTRVEKTVEKTKKDEVIKSIGPSVEDTKNITIASDKTLAKKDAPQKDKDRVAENIPSTIPPGKNHETTEIKAVISAQVPNPSILTLASYEFGVFKKQEGEGLDWIEKEQNGRIFNYRKIGHNQRSVFLYDNTRSIMIEIDLQDNTIRSGVSGDGLRPLYDIIEASNSIPETNPAPLTDDSTGVKLSYMERTRCNLKGGKVESSGILGNERCAMNYADGGNICIDSSNCEGLCIAVLSSGDEGKAVSGTCQMNNNPFGCYAEIVSGQASPTLCVD